MKDLPMISVNIPVIQNGDYSIVLESLKNINYPKDKFEIIIVEGRQIAKQRNEGIKNSVGEIVCLLDDDSKILPDAFLRIAKKFKDSEISAVGGPSLPPPKESSYLDELIAYALETHFGALKMRYRYSQQRESNGNEYRLIGANLALRKSVVDKIGGFDEHIVPSEESELLRRIELAGYKMFYDEELYIYRHHRENLFKLAKQFQHYGKGRMKTILKSPVIGDLIFLVPIGFLIYLTTLIFYHPVWYQVPLFVYLTAAAITTIYTVYKYKNIGLFGAFVIFPIVHIFYAIGLLKELILRESTTAEERMKFDVKKLDPSSL